MRSRFLVFFALLIALLAGCGSDDEGGGIKPPAPDVTSISEDYVYEIPVIFHVLYDNSSDPKQYINAAWLREALEHVNELYQGGIYAKSVNMKVRFVPAQTDEQGKALPFPGVEYRKYHAAYPIDPYDFMNDKGGAQGNWQ